MPAIGAVESSSFFSRIYTDIGNTLNDAYVHLVHGDDTGEAETFVFVVRGRTIKSDYGKQTCKFDLGITFVEVDGRAYVKKVVPNSEADLAGVIQKDCLQLAIVLGGNKQMEELRKREDLAAFHALRCEKDGRRTSYDELQKMFQNCTIQPESPKSIAAFAFENNSNPVDDPKDQKKRTFSKKIRHTTQLMVGRCHGSEFDNMTNPVMPASDEGDVIYPVALVFRRTQNHHLKGYPTILPSFRLDEECERAASLIQILSPTLNENLTNTKTPNAKTYDLKENVEAATIRGLIQNAVGLAFIHMTKVVVGISIHYGSGVVISRLSDGTWSAPSAIGMCGAGFGVQFGLEVAEYLFIIQSQEAMDHFRRGANFTIGGNMGAAVASIGREAYGAASFGESCHGLSRQPSCSMTDKNSQVAPIVAYAKSQGLYFGVSVEGSQIYTRNDINMRTYKVITGKELSPTDILSGDVQTPAEAEILYRSLHSVEYAHDISKISAPPKILLNDLDNEWHFDNTTLLQSKCHENGNPTRPFNLITNVGSRDGNKVLHDFETEFKHFLHGGVSVQRTDGASHNARDRRTLWLVKPRSGSLRLGYVSKVRNLSNFNYDDRSGSVSILDSKLENSKGDFHMEESTVGGDSYYTFDRGRKFERRLSLSDKYSMALTDITFISRSMDYSTGDEEKKGLMLIKDCHDTQLSFLTANEYESDLLLCGLKILVETEIARLGIRGGVPITQLRHRNCRSLKSPSQQSLNQVRAGYVAAISNSPVDSKSQKRQLLWNSSSNNDIECSSSDSEVEASSENNGFIENFSHEIIPEKRTSWSQVPTRNHLRGEASSNSATCSETCKVDYETDLHHYIYGKPVEEELVNEAVINFPFAVTRALLLDFNSPLKKQYNVAADASTMSRGSWTFSTNVADYSQLSESERISRSSIQGASRVIEYQRTLNGRNVEYSETHLVDVDEDDFLVLVVTEKTPRRGFSVKLMVKLTPTSAQSCQIHILSQIRPMGKNMTDQGLVHRAYCLVKEELINLYGNTNNGLIHVLSKMSNPSTSLSPFGESFHTTFSGKSRTDISIESTRIKKSFPVSINSKPNINSLSDEVAADWVSFGDVSPFKSHQLHTPNKIIVNESIREKGATSITSNSMQIISPERMKTPTRLRPSSRTKVDHYKRSTASFRKDIERPSNITKFNISPSSKSRLPNRKLVDDIPLVGNSPQMMIEVKPLPKLRLDLMPAPREEDEENMSVSVSDHKEEKKVRSRKKRRSRK